MYHKLKFLIFNIIQIYLKILIIYDFFIYHTDLDYTF